MPKKVRNKGDRQKRRDDRERKKLLKVNTFKLQCIINTEYRAFWFLYWHHHGKIFGKPDYGLFFSVTDLSADYCAC